MTVSYAIDRTLPPGGVAKPWSRRVAASPCDSLTGHSARAVVAKIGLLRSAACVGEREPEYCALALAHLGAAFVANENGLSSHRFPPSTYLTSGERSGKRYMNHAARLAR